jgi:hypothetical protein
MLMGQIARGPRYAPHHERSPLMFKLKKVLSLSLILAALVAAWVPTVNGQALVQQSATRLDATTQFATVVASATTLTITPPAGQFVYITGIEASNTQSGTVVTAAAQTTVTSTGLGGGITPVWTFASGGAGAAAGGVSQLLNVPLATPIKSNTAGAAVTFVNPTFATNQTIRFNVYFYYGL